MERYRQFLRSYRVVVTSKSAGVAFDVSELRCVFDVQKQTSGTPNNATVAICNVSSDSVAAIQEGDIVTVEAGYKNGNFGLIFRGEVVQAILSKDDDLDSALTLVCQDGDQFMSGQIVMATIGAGSSQQDIIDECIDGSNVSKGDVKSGVSENLLPRGKVLFGRSAEYIEQIAKSNKSQFYVEDGIVNIIGAQTLGTGYAIELSPMTGLIGTPEQTDDGVKGKCLINPSMRLNTQIYIRKDYVNAQLVSKGDAKKVKELNTSGIYKITKLKFSGDTHGDDWYCEFEAINMSGTVTGSLIDAETNVWG